MFHSLAALLPIYLAWQITVSPAMQAKAAGVKAAQSGDYEEAQRQFHQACSLDPKLANVCFYEGRSLYYLNRFEDALVPLRKSLELGEGPARAHSTIAECLNALGRAQDAEAEHKAALSIQPTSEYLLRFAVFLFRQGRASESIEPLAQALKLEPGNFQANLQMGRALFELNRFAEAMPFLEKALQTRPASTQAHLLAAKVCQRLGRTSEAERHLKAATVPEP